MCLYLSDLCAHRALALAWPCGNTARIGIYHPNFTPAYLSSWVDFENFEGTSGGCGIPLYKAGAALAGGSIPQQVPPPYTTTTYCTTTDRPRKRPGNIRFQAPFGIRTRALRLGRPNVLLFEIHRSNQRLCIDIDSGYTSTGCCLGIYTAKTREEV